MQCDGATRLAPTVESGDMRPIPTPVRANPVLPRPISSDAQPGLQQLMDDEFGDGHTELQHDVSEACHNAPPALAADSEDEDELIDPAPRPLIYPKPKTQNTLL